MDRVLGPSSLGHALAREVGPDDPSSPVFYDSVYA